MVQGDPMSAPAKRHSAPPGSLDKAQREGKDKEKERWRMPVFARVRPPRDEQTLLAHEVSEPEVGGGVSREVRCHLPHARAPDVQYVRS